MSPGRGHGPPGRGGPHDFSFPYFLCINFSKIRKIYCFRFKFFPKYQRFAVVSSKGQTYFEKDFLHARQSTLPNKSIYANQDMIK